MSVKDKFRGMVECLVCRMHDDKKKPARFITEADSLLHLRDVIEEHGWTNLYTWEDGEETNVHRGIRDPVIGCSNDMWVRMAICPECAKKQVLVGDAADE